MRRVLPALVAVAGAVALAWAAAPSSQDDDDRTPEGAARAFAAAAREGDRAAVLSLLAPATRARVVESAEAAGGLAGGTRRYAPLDVLEVGAGLAHAAPTRFLARDHTGDRAVVDVLGPDGRRDVVQVVRLDDGRWRVLLEL
jgi:hypothetical protein